MWGTRSVVETTSAMAKLAFEWSEQESHRIEQPSVAKQRGHRFRCSRRCGDESAEWGASPGVQDGRGHVRARSARV